MYTFLLFTSSLALIVAPCLVAIINKVNVHEDDEFNDGWVSNPLG